MKVTGLNREQKKRLKVQFREMLDGHLLRDDEIERIDEIVSDSEIYSWYDGIEFDEEDF